MDSYNKVLCQTSVAEDLNHSSHIFFWEKRVPPVLSLMNFYKEEPNRHSFSKGSCSRHFLQGIFSDQHLSQWILCIWREDYFPQRLLVSSYDKKWLGKLQGPSISIGKPSSIEYCWAKEISCHTRQVLKASWLGRSKQVWAILGNPCWRSWKEQNQVDLMVKKSAPCQ